MTFYDFDEKLSEGLQGERLLDRHFSAWFKIEAVGRTKQRQGIDRIYRRRTNGEKLTVEYKTDKRAAETSNAFVETVSVRQPGHRDKPGWAYSSQADMLLYYVPTDELVYVFRFEDFRKQLPHWARMYPTRNVPNKSYVTIGMLVPLAEFEEHALSVVSL